MYCDNCYRPGATVINDHGRWHDRCQPKTLKLVVTVTIDINVVNNIKDILSRIAEENYLVYDIASRAYGVCDELAESCA